jgi:hypothetical protein
MTPTTTPVSSPMPTPEIAAQQAEALRLRRRFGRQIGLAFVFALGLCLVMLARTS